MAKITIHVEVDDMFESYAAAIDVDDFMQEAFEPLKTTDDPLVALAVGEVMPDSQAARKVRKLREDSAQQLSDLLTTHVINAMSIDDTHNGYSNGD